MLRAIANIFRKDETTGGAAQGPAPATASVAPPAGRPIFGGRAVPPPPLGGYDEGRVHIPGIELLPDEELQRLNALLPWAAFVVDSQGRRFGAPYSAHKRNVPQLVPDPRIIELDRRMPLAGRTVLEIGCFEGIHTTALAQRAGRVLACDSRIENVVKTTVRCAMFGVPAPHVFRWDAEEAPPSGMDLGCDVLHHVGVLYHLTDPVGHLRSIAPLVRDGIMLDTQVAPEDAEARQYESGGRPWRYMHYREAGREAPFAGMLDHAKWLFRGDLVALLRELGFNDLHEESLVQSRNGPRWLVYARR
ncbi:MAG TPA: methyltransferase domain-containing protein [Falsiroseomonas sp.]|nr:methyltransferase domain-containing protein [Falsiroseomonas sp.]